MKWTTQQEGSFKIWLIWAFGFTKHINPLHTCPFFRTKKKTEKQKTNWVGAEVAEQQQKKMASKRDDDIHAAARNGDVTTVELIISSNPIATNSRDKHSRTPYPISLSLFNCWQFFLDWDWILLHLVELECSIMFNSSLYFFWFGCNFVV